MIISISSQKGGTGKTTSAVNISSGLSYEGKKVLVVDMDPQANLSQSLGIMEPKNTVEDWMLGLSKFDETVIKKKNLHIIPSDIYFDENKIESPYRLKKSLSKIKNKFDYIFLDLPPHLGILTLNGFMVSTCVFTIVRCDLLSLLSIRKLLELIDKVKGKYNPNLEFMGIIPNFYFSNETLSNDIVKKLKIEYGEMVFPPIRKNVALSECPIYKKSIFEYAPTSNGSKDFSKIVKIILERLS